jgi:hypothetical protein
MIQVFEHMIPEKQGGHAKEVRLSKQYTAWIHTYRIQTNNKQIKRLRNTDSNFLGMCGTLQQLLTNHTDTHAHAHTHTHTDKHMSRSA